MSTLRQDFDAWYRVMFAENPNRPGALTEWLAYHAATERAARFCDAESERLNGYVSAERIGLMRLAAAIRGEDGGGR
jgi:hypothetical protein